MIKNQLIMIISALTGKVETNLKALKFNNTVKISKHKNIFSKGYLENWSRETFIINSMLKTSL